MSRAEELGARLREQDRQFQIVFVPFMPQDAWILDTLRAEAESSRRDLGQQVLWILQERYGPGGA